MHRTVCTVRRVTLKTPARTSTGSFPRAAEVQPTTACDHVMFNFIQRFFSVPTDQNIACIYHDVSGIKFNGQLVRFNRFQKDFIIKG